MFTLNKASFSGTILDVKTHPNGPSLLKVEQLAFGIMPTRYTLFIPKGIEPPALGEKISVKDSLCYEKDGERRFKVLSQNQITEGDLGLNEHSFTGVCMGWHQVGGTKNVKVEISQDVLGELPTAFLLFLPEKQQRELVSPVMEPGDYVIVTNAGIYEKDGEWRYKIQSVKDMVILYFRDYNKGVIDAQHLKKEE